jgi:hypothetical protein
MGIQRTPSLARPSGERTGGTAKLHAKKPWCANYLHCAAPCFAAQRTRVAARPYSRRQRRIGGRIRRIQRDLRAGSVPAHAAFTSPQHPRPHEPRGTVPKATTPSFGGLRAA